MRILIKNKDTLIYNDFKFKCCVGKKGFTSNKVEGDNKTPIGLFHLDKIYFRKDRKIKPNTKLNLKIIKKNMGWCNDKNSEKKYNKLIFTNTKFRYEKLFRRDYKYDYLIPIKYNWNKIKLGKGR